MIGLLSQRKSCCMKKVDRPVAGVVTRLRPAQVALLAVIALALVALLLPLTIHPLLAWWQRSTLAGQEPWPAVPPTYAPPALVALDQSSTQAVATPVPAPVWQELSYLTSVEFTASTVVQEERTTEVPWLGKMVSDRLLMKVVGEVQVGIDLAQVTNVQIEGKKIRFTAPKPVVTSVELLPQQSQIYENVNVWLLSQYPGLETTALERARQQIRHEIATNDSMMKLAQEFARLQLVEFLEKAGFSTVEVTFAQMQEQD